MQDMESPRFFLHTLWLRASNCPDRAEAGFGIFDENEVAHVVGQVVTGNKLVGMFPGILNSYLSLKVALHANRVASRGTKFRGIHDSPTLQMGFR